MWHRTARVLAAMAGGAALAIPGGVAVEVAGARSASPAWAAPAPPARVAAAQARGVTVQITELPEQFVAGAEPAALTVVASKRGGQCQKVRWSMLLEVDGMSLEQVRVRRVEQEGTFGVDVDTDGPVARITDEQLDPGTLCRARTVTARYEINVANDVRSGELTLLVEAYDTDLRLLERDGATREVVADPAAAEPEDAGTGQAQPAPDAGGGAAAQPPGGAEVDQAAADDAEGIPLAWFLIGGLMVFLGLSLLLNVRWRQRDREEIEPLPVADRLSNYRTVPRRSGPRRR